MEALDVSPAPSRRASSKAASFARVSTSVARLRHHGRLLLSAKARRPVSMSVAGPVTPLSLILHTLP